MFVLWRPASIVAFLLIWSGIGDCADLSAGPTTVILIRHAERASFLTYDSPISKKGQRRAEGLAYLLDQYHPTTLIASNLIRTQQTLNPLANRLLMPIGIWDSRQSESLGHYLRSAYPGKSVIVCWHHDHMEELARALGVQGKIPNWSLFTFDKIWTVTLELNGQARFRESLEWDAS